MKVKLRGWVKVVLYTLFIIVVVLVIYDMKNHKTIINEVGKHYTCYGSVIKVCSGTDYDVE